MVRAAGGLLDAGDFLDGEWTDATMGSGFSAVGSFTPRSRLVTDGMFVTGRVIRTGNSTGTITWATLADGHRPVTVWEINSPWIPNGGPSGSVRAYLDTDGGIRTVNTPSSMNQIYFTFFCPTK